MANIIDNIKKRKKIFRGTKPTPSAKEEILQDLYEMGIRIDLMIEEIKKRDDL